MWIKTHIKDPLWGTVKSEWVNTETLMKIDLERLDCSWKVCGYMAYGSVRVALGLYQTKEQAEQAIEEIFSGIKANLHNMEMPVCNWKKAPAKKSMGLAEYLDMKGDI